MRVLHQDEITQVGGALFADDIGTLAASAVVIQYLYKGAVITTSHLINHLPSAMAGSSYQATAKLLAQIVPPLSGMAVPALLANRIFSKHPEYWDSLVEKFNTYF